MPSCVFRYCKNTTKNIGKLSGVTFHRFLRLGQQNRDTWIEIVRNNRSEATWLPTEYSCVCSEHFKPDDFHITHTGKRFLRQTAIPEGDPLDLGQNLKSTQGGSNTIVISDVELKNVEKTRELEFKKYLKKTIDAKLKLAKKNYKLQRQNRHLKKKTEKLIAIVKKLKQKLGASKKSRGTQYDKLMASLFPA